MWLVLVVPTCNILSERWIVEKEENVDEPWVRESLSDLETLFSPRQSCPEKFLSHSHLVLVTKRQAAKKVLSFLIGALRAPSCIRAQ